MDYRRLKCSGPSGRIVEADVLAAAKETLVPSSFTMRRTIAHRTAESFALAPHFYLATGVDATALLERREWLRGAAGSMLHRRLASAEFDERSFCAVAGLSLRPHRATARTECCVGDAITMIPPVTGNGMSMAFESGEMAIEPLVAWSRGETGWEQAQHTLAPLRRDFWPPADVGAVAAMDDVRARVAASAAPSGVAK